MNNFKRENIDWFYGLKDLQYKFPEDEKFPVLIKAIENGYEYFYNEVREKLKRHEDVSLWPDLHVGVGKATCDLVVDVLGLFKEFYIAQGMHGKDEIPDKLIAFRGFDPETESKHFDFCCFMLEDAYKIQPEYEYNGITSNPYFRQNSHREVLPFYKKMLERANETILYKYGNGTYMSPKEVRYVLGFNN